MAYQLESLSHRSTASAASERVGFSLWDLFRLHRQRRALAEMDASALDDMGISHRDAQIEAARPFWQVPTSWAR